MTRYCHGVQKAIIVQSPTSQRYTSVILYPYISNKYVDDDYTQSIYSILNQRNVCIFSCVVEQQGFHTVFASASPYISESLHVAIITYTDDLHLSTHAKHPCVLLQKSHEFIIYTFAFHIFKQAVLNCKCQ